MTSTELEDSVAPAQPMPNVEMALAYLEEVKTTFKHDPDVYNRFLDLMREFRVGQTHVPQVVNRAVELFRGHPELVEGLNSFLPIGYQLQVVQGQFVVTTPTGTTTGPL